MIFECGNVEISEKRFLFLAMFNDYTMSFSGATYEMKLHYANS